MADIVRIFGLGPDPAIVGLVLSAVAALAGVWAAMLWHRLGDVRLAVNLCGVAGLLASPVSWLHHFVWVVPLAMSLLERRPISPRRLPAWFLAVGWLFVGWVVVAPFTDLPNGADVELSVDLVAASARLDHRRRWPRPAGRGDLDRATPGADDLRSPRPEVTRAAMI